MADGGGEDELNQFLVALVVGVVLSHVLVLEVHLRVADAVGSVGAVEVSVEYLAVLGVVGLERLQLHLVLGERACLVREHCVNLSQFLVQV